MGMPCLKSMQIPLSKIVLVVQQGGHHSWQINSSSTLISQCTYHSRVHHSFGHKLAKKAEFTLNFGNMIRLGCTSKWGREKANCRMNVASGYS